MWKEDDPMPELSFRDPELHAFAQTLLRFEMKATPTHPFSAYLARMLLRALSEEESHREKRQARRLELLVR